MSRKNCELPQTSDYMVFILGGVFFPNQGMNIREMMSSGAGECLQVLLWWNMQYILLFSLNFPPPPRLPSLLCIQLVSSQLQSREGAPKTFTSSKLLFSFSFPLSLLLPQRLPCCQIFFWWTFWLWNACRSLPVWFCSSETLQQQKVRARLPVLNYILKSLPMSKAKWIINQMKYSMWPFMYQIESTTFFPCGLCF